MSSAEAALERLLLRIVPGLPQGWRGASDAEIARLETIAGRPLPGCYRWFLSRMGQSMGAMAYPTVDFSAQAVLNAYERGAIEPDRRFLLIGHEHDELMPLHYFYDLDSPARDDALVVRMLSPRDESHEQFETLREMLAWGELWAQRVERAPQHCRGRLRCEAGALLGELAPRLHGLGFEAPIATGEHCGLFEREDATLLCTGSPDEAPSSQTFCLGGRSASALGQLLGDITRAAALELTLSAWSPPLPLES